MINYNVNRTNVELNIATGPDHAHYIIFCYVLYKSLIILAAVLNLSYDSKYATVWLVKERFL